MRPLLPAVLALGLAVPAAAGEGTRGLAWLGEESVRFQLTSRIELPQVFHVEAEHNLEGRVSDLRVQVVTTCEPEARRRVLDLTCDLDAISLAGAPVASAPGRVGKILEEWSEKLTGARVEVTLGRNGRVRGLRLDGVDMESENARTTRIRGNMRVLLQRPFALLDLELPRRGDDRGRSWTQRESLALGFVSQVGTQGRAPVEHEVTDHEGAGIVAIRSEGAGTLGSGQMVAVGGQERPANLYEMTLTGTARFDTERGRLLERTYRARGTPTASSVDAVGGEGYPYVQTARLQVLEGEDTPELRPTGELEPRDRPTTR